MKLYKDNDKEQFSFLVNNTTLSSDNPLRFPVKEKSHICEEGGAHLRISFWHLSMNFEKPENSEFPKNEKKKKKKMLEISSFYTCVAKPQS